MSSAIDEYFAKEKTVALFLDIDGVLLMHHNTDIFDQLGKDPILLPGIMDKFSQWDRATHKIILTTARKESYREETEKQLRKFGLFWDYLLMGVPSMRFVVNDLKPDLEVPMAVGINLKRNDGFLNLDLKEAAKKQYESIKV